MKKVLLALLSVVLFALTPSKKITYNGYISKIAINSKYLIAGLENGQIIIKDMKTLKNIKTLTLEKIHDFMGDLIPMPVYSLDISPDGKKLMILAQGEDSKRVLFIYSFTNSKLEKIFTTKATLMKGRFISEDKIFFALLSDEAILYDLKNKKNIYRTQVGSYVFSTFALNETKTLAVFGDESGALKVVDVKTGKKIKEIAGYNKDKTLSCDIKKELLINASSDMRVGVYDLKTGYSKIEIKTGFLPYGAAISTDLKYFAFQYDEQNDIALYSMNKKLIDTLKGHTMALNGIKFLDKNTILSFSPAEILIWKLN